MPKEPASYKSGNEPQHDPPSGQGNSESSAEATPFPALPSTRQSWNNSLESMPAFPTASYNQEDEFSGKNKSKPIIDDLSDLPPIPTIASRVSRSLVDQENQTQNRRLSDIPALPAEQSPFRLIPSKKNSSNWEPDLPQPAIHENDAPEPESLAEKSTPTPAFKDDKDVELVDNIPIKESEPSAEKSPLINAGLLEKIRSNQPHHDHNESESPFRSIAQEIPEPPTPSTDDSPTASFSSTNGETIANNATPFAETHRIDSPPRKQSKYTDKDLQDALRSLVGSSSEPTFNFSTHTNNFLEPMLRSTVRRAIAEQMAEASPFRDVPGWNKLAWKLRALMSSRTYEDILFDQTRRYQVEEVFLLRPQTRSLISYASNNPARHAKSLKVESTVKKIATKTASIANNQNSALNWDNDRQLVIRPGRHSILAAIVHGSPNHVLEADLDYILSQVENRLGKSLEDSHQAHLQILQPMLECCLLVQSLATSN